ncbi:hypothetical protein WJX84_002454, partial [Apatococcus fuscideae]
LNTLYSNDGWLQEDVRVLGVIGEGAFGEVSLASATVFGKIAIKWLKPGKVKSHSAQFWREADMLASLNHPSVLHLYGVVVDNHHERNVVGIMTEYMRGGSLSAALRGLKARNWHLSLAQRAELALNMATGLAYLHELQIVHFDLKSDNLLLDGPLNLDSQLPLLKVADFGLSKQKWSVYVTGVRDLRGTLPFMAPELVCDPDRISEKADVWSFGMVLWEMLMLETPFQHLSPQEIVTGLMMGTLRPEIPAWCEPEWFRLMESCWETNPNLRPSVKQLAAELEELIAPPFAPTPAPAVNLWSPGMF